MAKQREISNEQILYLLMDSRKKEAKESYKQIILNEEACKILGRFAYREKGKNNARFCDIFLISEYQDGSLVNIIYDDKGKVIAWQSEEEQMELQVAKDIELDRQMLERQINDAERVKNSVPSGSSSDTQKAGEGRDLGTKEHEENKDIKVNSVSNENNNQLDENRELGGKVQELKGKISLQNAPKIRLDYRINEMYLYDILQLENKLRGREPEGVSIASFRTGYLSMVDIDTFEQSVESDEKQKEELAELRAKGIKDIVVITTADNSSIIRLDKDVLTPRDLGSKEQQRIVAKSNMRFANGEETEKPDNVNQVTRTSIYEIPNASDKFNTNEVWYLAGDNKWEYQNENQAPIAGNTKEISFGQVSKEYVDYERDNLIRKAVECELKPENERDLVHSKSRQEEKHQAQLAKKGGVNEAKNIREDHLEKLTEICLKKYENWQDYYRKNEIRNKVEKYHNQGFSDEEIIEEVGRNISENEKGHDMPDFYEHNRRK